MPHNSGKPKRRNSILKVRPQQAEPVEVHEKGVTVECEETDVDLVHSKRVRRRVSFHSVRTVQHFDKIDNAMIHSPQKEPVADVTGSDGSRMSISTLSTPGKDKENTLILLKSGPASNSHLTSHMQLPSKQPLFDQTTRDNHDMSVSMVEHIHHADTTLDALCGAMGSKVPETPIGELKDRTVDLENSAQFFGGNDDLTATLFATAKNSQFPSSNNAKLVLDETNYNDMSMDITRNVDRTRGADNNETMMFLRGYGSAAAETGAANNTMFGCDDTIALFRNVGKKNGRKSLDVNRTQTAQIDMDITNMEKSRHVMNESQEERVDQSVVMDITQQHTSAAEGNVTLDLLSAPAVNEKEMIVDSNDTIALLSALPGTEKEYEQDSIVFEETRALLQQNSLPHRISEQFEKIQEPMDKQNDGMGVNDDTLFHLKNGTFTMNVGEAEKTSADMDITNMSDVHVDRHVTITVHERRTDHGRVTDRDVVSDQHTIEHTHGTNTVVETTKIEMEEEIERNGIDERRHLKQREIGSPMVVAKKKAKIGGQRHRGEEETSIAVDTTIREDLASMSLGMGESSGVADGEMNDKDKTVVTVSDDEDIMDVTETEDNNTLGGMDSGRSKQEYLPPRKPFRRPSSIHPSTSAPRSVLDRVTVPNCPDNLSLENIMRPTTPDTLILDGKKPHDNTSMEMSMGGHADSAPRSSRSGSASRLNLTARSDISSMDTSQLTARIACLGVQNVRYLDTEEGNEEFQEKWANVLQEELLAKARISNMFREAAVVNLKEFEPKFLEAAVKANGRKCGYAVEDAIVCAKYEADKEYHEIREQIAKEALNDIETLENDMAQKAAEKRKQMDQAEELEMLEREVSDINDRLLPFEGLKADEVEQMLGAHVEPIAVLSARLNLLLEQSEMAMEIADWVINDFHKKIVPSDLDWDKRNVTIRRNRGRLMEAVNMSNVVHSPMKKMCGVRNEMREESIVLSDGDDTMHADM